MGNQISVEDTRKQQVKELTSLMAHKHYVENDMEFMVKHFDEDILWTGAGEHEFATGKEQVSKIFLSFAGKIPKCNIWDEEYHALCLAPDIYLCSGCMWIATDPSTQICLRVHQRLTTIFRWVDGRPLCCHLHVSNPYQEMTEEDVGFPTKMARQSQKYLQEQVEEQKKLIASQTERLQRMSYQDALTGLYNQNKLNHLMDTFDCESVHQLGVAYFDLNGLKAVNDQSGHSAGDDLLRRAANELWKVFPQRAYRIGGDEFVVVDDQMSEEDFLAAVQKLKDGMDAQKISYSVGVSWRASGCNMKEQFDQADQRMYEDKRQFYRSQSNR